METTVVRFDWAIKHILRDKANYEILEGFLSALLNDDKIKILNILESETNQDNKVDKYNRVDIFVEDSKKRKIYIEIQNTRESDYIESLLYTSSKIIVENQDIGKGFNNISKVISISILYFNLGRGDDYIYYGRNDFRGVNTGEKLIIKKRVESQEDTTGFEVRYKFIEKDIFPEYYLITVERYKNIIKKRIDEWVYMLKNNKVHEQATAKGMEKIKETLNVMNMSKEQRKSYEKHLIAVARLKKAWEDSQIEGYLKGKKAGKEEGFDEGKKEGFKKGIEKEKQNSRKLIKKAEKEKEKIEFENKVFKLYVRDGKSIKEIAEIFEKTQEEITKILEIN